MFMFLAVSSTFINAQKEKEGYTLPLQIWFLWKWHRALIVPKLHGQRRQAGVVSEQKRRRMDKVVKGKMCFSYYDQCLVV